MTECGCSCGPSERAEPAAEAVPEAVVEIEINGQLHRKLIAPSTTLLDFLREDLRLTGTKRGCDVGDCGCCTVLQDGKPVLSCLTLAIDVQGRRITTIEGIGAGSGPGTVELHPVQEAMIDEGAIQCGYCTPAMVVNAVALLEENPRPSSMEIKECVSGTICRCTGYTKIERAVATAAERMQTAKGTTAGGHSR